MEEIICSFLAPPFPCAKTFAPLKAKIQNEGEIKTEIKCSLLKIPYHPTHPNYLWRHPRFWARGLPRGSLADIICFLFSLYSLYHGEKRVTEDASRVSRLPLVLFYFLLPLRGYSAFAPVAIYTLFCFHTVCSSLERLVNN